MQNLKYIIFKLITFPIDNHLGDESNCFRFSNDFSIFIIALVFPLTSTINAKNCFTCILIQMFYMSLINYSMC